MSVHKKNFNPIGPAVLPAVDDKYILIICSVVLKVMRMKRMVVRDGMITMEEEVVEVEEELLVQRTTRTSRYTIWMT